MRPQTVVERLGTPVQVDTRFSLTLYVLPATDKDRLRGDFLRGLFSGGKEGVDPLSLFIGAIAPWKYLCGGILSSWRLLGEFIWSKIGDISLRFFKFVDSWENLKFKGFSG